MTQKHIDNVQLKFNGNGDKFASNVTPTGEASRPSFPHDHSKRKNV